MTLLSVTGRSNLRLKYRAGIAGAPGWSPVFSVVEDGDRSVLQVSDWIGGRLDKPDTGQYVGAAGLVDDIEDAVDIRGDQGDQGDKGWSPVLAVVNDSERRVLQVTDWTGGAGTKPATGSYIGASGLVLDIASAIDIRGPQGEEGPPAGPHTHVASDITDSTIIGRNVLTAADAAAARGAIGAAAASHTHTASNVTDFSEAVDDRVAALLQAGTGISLSYSDASGSLTIASIGASSFDQISSGVTAGGEAVLILTLPTGYRAFKLIIQNFDRQLSTGSGYLRSRISYDGTTFEPNNYYTMGSIDQESGSNSALTSDSTAFTLSNSTAGGGAGAGIVMDIVQSRASSNGFHLHTLYSKSHVAVRMHGVNNAASSRVQKIGLFFSDGMTIRSNASWSLFGFKE